MVDQIKQVPEIQVETDKLKQLKKEVRRSRTKVNSLFQKYSFVAEIVNPNIDDLKLEYSIQALFKDLGFKTIKPAEKRDLDLFVEYLSNIIGIEIKNANSLRENDIFQVYKYAKRHESDGNKMHPLLIWNNTKTGQKFDGFRIRDAIINEYSLLTTSELLKGYILTKQNKIDLGTFYRQIISKGLVYFKY